MRINAKMRDRLAQEVFAPGKPLSPRIAALCSAEFVLRDGAVLLPTGLAPEAAPTSDGTGLEAWVNKIQIGDLSERGSEAWLQEGAQFCTFVCLRLEALGRPYRLILSRDPDSGDVSVRFFIVRPGEPPWGSKNPDDYLLEEVIQWGE